MRKGAGVHAELIPGTFRPVANRNNGYLMDRDAQEAGQYYNGVQGPRHAGRLGAGKHGPDRRPHQGKPRLHRQRHHHGAAAAAQGGAGGAGGQAARPASTRRRRACARHRSLPEDGSSRTPRSMPMQGPQGRTSRGGLSKVQPAVTSHIHILRWRPDEVAALIADFTANVAGASSITRIERAAKAALIDSIAVAMGALTHPAAQAARRHAYRGSRSARTAALIWGSATRATPDLAALTNGVLLRCYDYNDFFVGQRNSGHAERHGERRCRRGRMGRMCRAPSCCRRSPSATRSWVRSTTRSRPRRAAGTTPI